jgi:AtzE family amidohydrolase
VIDRTALEVAAAVRSREVTAAVVTEATLARIESRNAEYNAFTTVTVQRARKEAAAIDAALARGEEVGPLAGVPYAVKNLFDVAGLTTIAGSRIDADNPPAVRDAAAIRQLQAAGAVLVGALNMSEYAYGYTTENTHYGPARNPHDVARSAGGSSGGTAAALAGGLVPVALGSDTNGSIRVPSSLCGLFGLKPTFGRLSRQGVRLFAASFDHVGPMARSVRDLAAFYDAMQGPDSDDVVCAATGVEPVLPELDRGGEGLRIAIADDYFAPHGIDHALAAVEHVARALNISQRVTIPEAGRARAAAVVITAAESGNLHYADARKRPKDFDPTTRDHFLSGTLVPANWVVQAQRFRQWYRLRASELFRSFDIIITPATPCPAPLLGQEHVMTINGVEMTARRHLGMFTQPISFIGLPVVVAPVHLDCKLPIGIQIIAAPWRELDALCLARHLEREGIASAPLPASLYHVR